MPNDRPVYCLGCESDVSLARDSNGQLVVRCECTDKRRSLKVSRVLPERWT